MNQKKILRQKNKVIGKLGENLAARYLRKKGYQFEGANYHMFGGELDLIFKKNDILIFVEVKTRTTKTFGEPEMALTAFKKYKLLRTITDYICKKSLSEEKWQLDLIAIQLCFNTKIATIKHFHNVFAL